MIKCYACFSNVGWENLDIKGVCWDSLPIGRVDKLVVFSPGKNVDSAYKSIDLSVCRFVFKGQQMIVIIRELVSPCLSNQTQSPLSALKAFPNWECKSFTASWEDLPQLCFINTLELSYFRLQYLVSILTNEQRKVTLSVRCVLSSFLLSGEKIQKKNIQNNCMRVLSPLTTSNTFSKSI